MNSQGNNTQTALVFGSQKKQINKNVKHIEYVSGSGTAEDMFQGVRRHIEISVGAKEMDSVV